jgi:hypothetical protein
MGSDLAGEGRRRVRDAGLLPADLMEEVKGWTVLKRLRAGDQPEDVARLLRTSGEDQGASAS